MTQRTRVPTSQHPVPPEPSLPPAPSGPLRQIGLFWTFHINHILTIRGCRGRLLSLGDGFMVALPLFWNFLSSYGGATVHAGFTHAPAGSHRVATTCGRLCTSTGKRVSLLGGRLGGMLAHAVAPCVTLRDRTLVPQRPRRLTLPPVAACEGPSPSTSSPALPLS